MATSNTHRRIPAEWEPHRATWIAWPHEASDFPGKIQVIDWVYVEIIRALSSSEPVEILVYDQQSLSRAQECLTISGITENYRFHIFPTDRSWLRDSAPTAVKTSAENVEWIGWKFNAWAKYLNFQHDQLVPNFVSQITELPLTVAQRPDNNQQVVLEGGAIDCDGQGTLLTTEECLLSSVQERNPGLTRENYEIVFKQYLGVSKTIWLDRSCEGDDTHGHVDDVARFVAPAKVVLAFEENVDDPNHLISVENYERLKGAKDAQGRNLDVIRIPMPPPLTYDGYRLPASYANFYIANQVVLVPTFNHEKDRIVLNILADLFPKRRVIGIYCGDLVLGLGTIHCLSQQQVA